jgi:hypothetical protein
MKKIFLLSTFVLTQTIFATTLTIYNSNIALVEESQEISLSKNDETFSYKNIPNSIIHDSVNVSFDPSVTLYSQVYKRKNLTQHDLAKSFLNKEVELQNGSIVTLLSISGNNAIVTDELGKVFSTNISKLIFPYLPKNLQAYSSLEFEIKNKEKEKIAFDISYLMRNISFKSDYVLNIDKKSAQLTGWLDIANNSGKDFHNTKLNLVAGDINRAYNTRYPVAYESMAVGTTQKSTAPLHKSIGGYHKYTLPFKVDINAYEKRRVQLFDAKNLQITNNFVAQMNNPLYLMGERSSSVVREIELQALKRELPAGVVRIYTKDDSQQLLLGESDIRNTPKNTPLKLKVGKDFDTKVTQKVISRNDTKVTLEAKIAYSIINNSDEDKHITLNIPFTRKSGASVTSKLKYSYTKGNYVTFQLIVKANSKKSFEVEFKSRRR